MPHDNANQTKRQALQRHGTLNPRPQHVTHPLFQTTDFFDSNDLVQVKYEMLRQVELESRSVSESAKVFGFSRPSFYQAQAAFEQNGLPGLVPQKRGPRGGHKLTAKVMAFVVQAREQNPLLRSEQLAQRVEKRFGVAVHPRSIERQLALTI